MNEPTGPPHVFFGYPSDPKLRAETVRAAYQKLEAAHALVAHPWELLQISGRVVIDVILAEIDKSDVAAFEVTDLNHNVMFELGYAIGSGRKLWLFRDPSLMQAQKAWNRIAILTTIGYSSYVGSDELLVQYYKDQPALATETVFESSIKETLQPPAAPAIFYLRSLYQTDAESLIYRTVREQAQPGIKLITADPNEAPIYPLAWYAQQIFASDVVVIHLSSANRQDSDVHNSRCSLVAGLARGMDKPVLILAEDDYTSPIDYRDLVFPYPSAGAANQRAHQWLDERLAATRSKAGSGTVRARALELAVELSQLRLGEPIAENEVDSLADYFVDTANFQEVREGRTSLFVGRKGTGKTANLYVAASDLAGDPRNLVVVLKPNAYELEALTNLIGRYRGLGAQTYLIASLWEFLILTEIANVVYQRVIHGPELQPDSPEWRFARLMDDNHDLLMGEFAVRLEAAVHGLLGIQPGAEFIAELRETVARTLYSGILRQLRQELSGLLGMTNRIAILVDNLDQAWITSSDLTDLSKFLLGLLSAQAPLEHDIRLYTNRPIKLSLAVFLRSDIFAAVRSVAPEPDKLPVSRLIWQDRDLLARIVEERYSATHSDADPAEFWRRFWCPSVRDVPTRDYILGRILPRPRDLIFFCRAAVTLAINRRHAQVNEDDVQDAERSYSQFAFESLRVENGTSRPELDDILYEFYGAAARLSLNEVQLRLRRAKVDEADVRDVLVHLYTLSFIGVEIESGPVDYAPDIDTDSATAVLLRKGLSERVGFCVHPAFHAYLDIANGHGSLAGLK
jgi:hypothetical protein